MRVETHEEIHENLHKNTIKNLLNNYPYITDFFEQLELNINEHSTELLTQFLEKNKEILEDKSLNTKMLLNDLVEYIKAMQEFFLPEEELQINSLTIIAGVNKQNQAENFEKITIKPSQIIAIVGPTGSGKSRLLGDIEWLANEDTPTKRQILINEQTPDLSLRYSCINRLVAQLSQNMNFVIDATVYEFLDMHAECRQVENKEEIILKIIEKANELSGEKFDKNSSVTSLSGGQSRALMIADTAILSPSPIVLIDEIENAGIDRKRALDLLISQEKIVLMATHDPLLCLIADTRIVIKNGGIIDVITTTQDEKQVLTELSKLDKIMTTARENLRLGNKLTLPLDKDNFF